MRDVLVGERPAIGLILTGVVGAAAAEDEPGDVVRLRRVREQQRQRGHVGVLPEQRVELQIVVQRVRGAAPAQLERRGGIQHAGRREHVVRARVDEQRGRRELVAAVARPGRPVGLQDVLVVVHVAAGDPPVVRRLEVHPQQVFTALGAVGILALKVEAAAARVVRRREDVQRVDARCVEAVRRNPPEDAAVREAAAGIGGAAREARGGVADVRERVAAAVHALGEVTLTLEQRSARASDGGSPDCCDADIPGSRRRTAASCPC